MARPEDFGYRYPTIRVETTRGEYMELEVMPWSQMDDEKRDIRLVEVAKHIEPTMLRDIETLLSVAGKDPAYGDVVGRVWRWLSKLKALDRKGMR